MRIVLALTTALLAAGCGNTVAVKQPSTGSLSGSGSTGSLGSGSTTANTSAITSGPSSSGGTGSPTGSASTSNGTSGPSNASSGASSGTTSNPLTTAAAASSSSGSGACTATGEFVGVGNGSSCCSGFVDSNGYCAASATTSTSSGTTGTGSTSSSSSGGSSGTNICSTQACLVYAQTAFDLYSVDPTSLAQTHLCTFGGDLADQQVFDIAVRADGTMYAITSDALFQVDSTTCNGTQVASLGTGDSVNFNGLTFTLSGDLIAADSLEGDVDLIDPSSGAVSNVGNYGNGLGSSGDLVALSDGTIYATAIDPSQSSDVLVTVDPANSYAATEIGPIGFSQIYGVAYWAGVIYGFDAEGDVISIDPTTGVGTLVTNDSSLSWYGAGSTPKAPIVDE